ncbi:MBL fold metallo-hydrolase [Kineococcus gynurae]|uniref:MBL fold metallo-hydrolase n=1 Tax=Kineococcus gynurae TaxID=452979 RepID=A0ABV5LU88_9ACTN
MTLEGTNTWVLGEPGARRGVVVDPGEDSPAHRAAIRAELDRRALRCALVVVTHHHLDHVGGLDAFRAEHDDAPVRREPGTLTVDGLRMDVLATPGHTADSISVLLPAEASLLTGDTVLGRGSTVLAEPDGDLAAYLDSLDRLLALDAAVLLPGHGPARTDARAALTTQRDHRRARLEQVRAARASGLADLDALVVAVHGPLDERLHRAARASIRAQLAYLDDADT